MRSMRRLVLLLALTGVACSSSGASNPAPAASNATSTPTTPAPVATDAPAPAADAGSVCPRTGAVTVPGNIDAADVDEASGIVASTLNPEVYWVHNDSGDSARAFAVSSTGKLRATLKFDPGTTPLDIEDMAIEDTASGSFLYFGDIGDNDVARPSLTIHRVREPKLTGTSAVTLTADVETMTVKYGDAPHNAETLLFDPLTKDLLIVTKVTFGKAQVHRVGPFAAGTTATTTKIASIPVAVATGGAISRDGTQIAVRNYGLNAFLWTRAPGEDLATTFARTSCTIPVATEGQGEAFAFLPDASGYITVSEGSKQPLHLTRFE